MPAMVNDASVFAATAQEPPASVTVTVVPEVEPAAVQLVNPVPNVMVGDAGMLTKFGSKVAVIVLPAASEPAPEVRKPTAQLATKPVTGGLPVNVTVVTDPAPITIGEAGDAAAVSRLVATENPAAG